MALSLMPIDEVEQQFKRMREISSPSVQDLFVYFERQWINGGVSLSMWNFNDLDHRTNNISEGERGGFKITVDFSPFISLHFLAYNRRFSSRITKKRPNVWAFIQLIQAENARLEHIMVQLTAGASSMKPSSRTTTFQRRFETLQSRFRNKEIEIKQLLNGLTLLLGLHKKKK